MRKILIILAILTFIACNCAGATVKQGENDKNVVILGNQDELFDSENLGNKQNPLYGKVFKSLNDLPELKYSNKGLASSVIDEGKYENGKYRFGVTFFNDINGNSVCIFEELIESQIEGVPNYRILDTIHIRRLTNDETIAFCNCYKNKTLDSEIFAIVINEDKAFYDKIIKAWRANTKTGRIEAITNTEKISCENEGYGA